MSRLIASAQPLIIASETVSDRLRIAVASSHPFISGIPMSVNTASNSPLCASYRVNAIWPFSAATTSQPSVLRASAKTSRTAASSSTTNTRAFRRAVVTPNELPADNLDVAVVAGGKEILNVVPRPSSLSTSMEPLCLLTMPKLTARPIPVPAFPLVVKKGSNKRDFTSGGIPVPVSVTVRITRSLVSCALIRISPPPGIASSAL